MRVVHQPGFHRAPLGWNSMNLFSLMFALLLALAFVVLLNAVLRDNAAGQEAHAGAVEADARNRDITGGAVAVRLTFSTIIARDHDRRYSVG